MFNQTMFDKIVGPTCTLAEMQALTPRGLQFYNRWTTKIEEHWAAFGAGTSADVGAMTNVHQYDRGIQYYTWYKMSGYTNNTWRDRARATTIAYRDMLLASGFTQIYFHEMKQLAAHYAETGDTESLRCLGDQGDYVAATGGGVSSWLDNIPQGYGQGADCPPNSVPYFPGNNELRPWQRAFETMLMCYCTGAPSDGSPSYAGGHNWLTKSQWALDRLLANQWPDGFYRAHDTKIFPAGPGLLDTDNTYLNQELPWAYRPFFMFLIGNVLIRAYEIMGPDARILTCVKNLVDALFTTPVPSGYATDRLLWVPTDIDGQTNAFVYLSRQTYDEHFAFDPYAGWHTGDPVYPASGWGPGGPYPPPESQGGSTQQNATPDLNGLGINLPAWVYNKTGIQQYKDWAIAMLDGPCLYSYIETTGGSNPGKRFNESMTESPRGIANIIATPNVSSPDPKRIRGKWRDN